MTPFTVLTGPGAFLPRANVDTDQILPARFLRKPRSAGYQNFLFHDLRATPGFPVGDGVVALVAGANFGCGSSREGAVYGLVDAGLRCVIAPSFGDIFAANAGKNGLLTITLPEEAAVAIGHGVAGGETITIDLPAQEIRLAGATHRFDIDAFRKHCLLEGLDDIGLTARHQAEITAFEAADARARPWATPGAS
jgi:3-isopropylmalate/(R)-2-methylmalate dehydratase small subunit